MPVKGSVFLATQEKNLAREGGGHVGRMTAVPESKPIMSVGRLVIAFGRNRVIFVFISPPDT